MTLKVDYINNFETKAIDVIRDLAPNADKIEIAVAFLSIRGWLELKSSINSMLEKGGKFRIIVRGDKDQTSPLAVAQIFELPNTIIAFGLSDSSFYPKDYLFYHDKKLNVLTSSANATYPGLNHNDEGGAIITHSDFNSDDSAQKAILIFQRRWENATIVTKDLLEQFKKESEKSDFQIGSFVRSKNQLYKSFGIGKIQKVRNDQCKVQFDPTVFSNPPYRSENKILPLNDLELVETPFDRIKKGRWEDAWKFEMKMMAARLLTANIGD